MNAPKLIVDNIKNQLVSLRVEGDGIISTTSVRTDSYLADNTPDGYGLSRIELDLDDGVKVNYEKIQTASDGKKYAVLAKI